MKRHDMTANCNCARRSGDCAARRGGAFVAGEMPQDAMLRNQGVVIHILHVSG